jgi:hypothetical protein
MFALETIRKLAARFPDLAEKNIQAGMVSLSEIMPALHKTLAAAQSLHEKLEGQIKSTDGQIDSLVYELYGTGKKIKIVEVK